MNQPVEFLDLDDIIELARRLLGEPVPIRDAGLLAAAVARPRTSIGGRDAYPDTWAKAAALLQSLVNSHPLIDGNQRLGWLATAVFLELNDCSAAGASNDSVYDLVMHLASGSPDIDEIAASLRRLGDEA